MKLAHQPGCACCGGGPPDGGPYVTLPGCGCTYLPYTMTMTTSGPCLAGDFDPCTLAYGPTPPEYSALGLGPNVFLSTATFTDAYTGDPYRWNLRCSSSLFLLARVYPPKPPDRGAYLEATAYQWPIGSGGNTCLPIYLHTGTIYPGGNPACKVYIDP